MTTFLLTLAVFVLACAALGVGALRRRPLARRGCSPADCAVCERKSN